MNRIIRDLKVVDFFLVPSSFIRAKLGIEKDIGRKINNLWYIPATILEIGRLYGYCKCLENYFK